MAWVEKDHNAHLAPNPAVCRVANQQPRLPRATSSLALNASRAGASTAVRRAILWCKPRGSQPLWAEGLPPTCCPELLQGGFSAPRRQRWVGLPPGARPGCSNSCQRVCGWGPPGAGAAAVSCKGARAPAQGLLPQGLSTAGLKGRSGERRCPTPTAVPLGDLRVAQRQLGLEVPLQGKARESQGEATSARPPELASSQQDARCRGPDPPYPRQEVAEPLDEAGGRRHLGCCEGQRGAGRENAAHVGSRETWGDIRRSRAAGDIFNFARFGCARGEAVGRESARFARSREIYWVSRDLLLYKPAQGGPPPSFF